ncbi:MAG: hypothetical protein M3Q55_16450 [Acidobacteriota bacterium]|nr:hypothetical protein [Acidobacteriota bacterium]
MAKTNPVEQPQPNPHTIPAETSTGGKLVACPSCDTDVSKVEAIGGVLTCSVCARTLVLEKGAARLATAADVTGLTEGQRVTLRKGRPAAWRAERAERVKAIRGRK